MGGRHKEEVEEQEEAEYEAMPKPLPILPRPPEPLYPPSPETFEQEAKELFSLFYQPARVKNRLIKQERREYRRWLRTYGR
jgi:hypothetical protein